MNAQAATLRHAVVPRSDLLTDALLVLAGTGLVAVGNGWLAARHGDRHPSSAIAAGAWRLVERTSRR